MSGGPTLDRDIDVGRAGLTGHYSKMTGLIRSTAPRAILAIGVWLVVLNLPPIVDYHLSADLTVGMIAKVILIFWTLKIAWPLLQAVYYAWKWVGLESIGMRWVTKNDHALRVVYYRRSDNSIQLNSTTRFDRLKEELQAAEYRKRALIQSARNSVIWAVIYIVMPLAFAYAYEFFNSNVRGFIDNWNVLGVLRWLIFYLRIIPQLVKFAMAVFESVVYETGAQFIPGAKLRDPVVAEKTIETLRNENIHGAADFVAPDDAAKQMAN